MRCRCDKNAGGGQGEGHEIVLDDGRRSLDGAAGQADSVSVYSLAAATLSISLLIPVI